MKIQLFFSTEPVVDVKKKSGFEKLLSEFNVFFSYCSQNAFIEEVR